jgi:DNA-binding NarL/FixJ family response regulator
MIRLLLVDDQRLIRQAIKTMLELETDLQVVGSAENGETALEQVAALHPDVVLMDLQMPIRDGKTATRKIAQQFPEIKVLVLSTFDDDQYVADAMRAGASGYLLKDMPSEELAQAIRLVHGGYTQLGPGLMEKLMINVPDPKTVEAENTPKDLTHLTSREKDLLRLIGKGCTNREIATQLHLAEGTIKTYVTHLLDRLNLKNRAQVAIYSNSIALALNS